MKTASPPVLHTPRLRIRPFTGEDGALLHRLTTNREVFFWREQPVAFAETEELLTTIIAVSEPGLGWWPVFLNPGETGTTDETRDFLGQVCVQPLPGSNELELGYHFLPQAWGKGYATEAATTLLRYFFDATQSDHISAVVLPDNHRSLRVVDRLGFIQRGTRLHGKKPQLHHYFELNRSSFADQMARPAFPGE